MAADDTSTGDGGTTDGSGEARIRECGRTVGGGIVVFDITWDGTLAGTTVAWVVTIDDEEGSERVVLCHERTGGPDGTARQFVAADGRQQDVRTDATVEDDHVTARFPAEIVGVAAEWPVWKALLVVDGAAISEQVIPTT
ncbi:hypothetical protein G7072_10390 [Nocardioides sp. HDW12B]|uniref:hypothetical protein n=1 Tax=Nocardioides sp. HDW12B TaxID=2714939 RepID=UPI00140E41D7|nr:hypothetical protein [Nocardioides sp. HDW12B]QIK66693.1 hypothetical protein G7072_10390 [Nocardioides sp. HDW12B]